jgi:hypothetical protein
VTDSIMSLDGSSVVCGYATTMGASTPAKDLTTTGFIRYSTRTGKPTQVFGASQFRGEAGSDISARWTNATGKTLIGGILTPAESASA